MKVLKVFLPAACAAGVLMAGAADEIAGRVTGKMTDHLLVAGNGRACLIRPDGSVAWKQEKCGNIHRVWLHGGCVWYSNGNLHRADIVSGKSECVYRPCPKEGLYGFEVLKSGNVVIAENGTDFLTELKAGTTEPAVRFKTDPRGTDGKMPNAHHHYRMVRKTAAGTYLVCCSGATLVREYDAAGKLIWEQPTPRKTSGHAPVAFDVLRRANGNTLVSHLGAVTEFTPDHRVAWSFACSDAPELKLDNLCGLSERPNGNLIIGTYANGKPDGSRATAFEVTRQKKIVWAYWSTSDRSMMTAEPVALWRWPVGVVPVTAAEAAEQDRLVKAAVPAKPAAARRILVVSRAFGYCHNDALVFGDRAFARAGELTGAWRADVTHDVSRLADAAFLSAYDALVINNSTMIKARNYPGMTEALTGFVRAGKGLCLVHSAVDSFYEDEAIADMNGGLFRGHPWMAGGTWSFRNEEPSHPLNAAFRNEPNPFSRSDEIYQQTGPAYSRAKDRVLLSMNLADAPTAAAAKRWADQKRWLRDDGDFAVSWVRRYGKGRVFYTSFGHDRRAFLDAARLGHLFAGLQYCLGDLPCEDAPRN